MPTINHTHLSFLEAAHAHAKAAGRESQAAALARSIAAEKKRQAELDRRRAR